MKSISIMLIALFIFAQDTHLCLAQNVSSPPSPVAVTADPYYIAPDDVLDITVLGEEELSKIVTVLPDGRISYPYLGEAVVAGETLDELTHRITKALSTDLVAPRVTVSVRERHIKQISVLGAVKTPGKFAIKEGWHVLDALAEAGGLTVDRPEWVSAVLVEDNGAVTTPIDMTRLLATADPSENRLLAPDDVLLVQELDAAHTSVQVLGEVTKPGMVPAPTDGSVASVITAVGGTTPQAALAHALVLRGSQSLPLDLRNLTINGHVSPDISLQPGDTLVIPPNRLQYAVFGAVHTPGAQDVSETKPLTILSAVTTAGGTTADADLRGVTLVRPTADGKATTTAIDLEKLLKKGDLSQNLPMQPGDILYVPAKRTGNNPFRISDIFPYISLIGLFSGR